jgi:hypothetical protein
MGCRQRARVERKPQVKIELKFDVDDKAWYIARTNVGLPIACPVCKGMRKVTLESRSFQCPHCLGSAIDSAARKIVRRAKVAKVSGISCFKDVKGKSNARYLLSNLWSFNSDELYATKQEVDAAIAKEVAAEKSKAQDSSARRNNVQRLGLLPR